MNEHHALDNRRDNNLLRVSGCVSAHSAYQEKIIKFIDTAKIAALIVLLTVTSAQMLNTAQTMILASAILFGAELLKCGYEIYILSLKKGNQYGNNRIHS